MPQEEIKLGRCLLDVLWISGFRFNDLFIGGRAAFGTAGSSDKKADHSRHDQQDK
jgi:hypothetical protein